MIHFTLMTLAREQRVDWNKTWRERDKQGTGASMKAADDECLNWGKDGGMERYGWFLGVNPRGLFIDWRGRSRRGRKTQGPSGTRGVRMARGQPVGAPRWPVLRACSISSGGSHLGFQLLRRIFLSHALVYRVRIPEWYRQRWRDKTGYFMEVK